MNWFARLFGAAPEPALPANRDPTDDRWYGVGGEVSGWTPAGLVMTYDMALQIPAVIACLTVLSEDVAKLPIGLFRKRGDHGKQPVPEHPMYSTLHHRPNRYQTAFEFRQQMQWDVSFWRNAYALIGDGDRGRGTDLHRLDPRRMTPHRESNGYTYEYRDRRGHTSRYSDEQVMHLRMSPLDADDGARGLSMLETSSHVLAQAFAVQEFGSYFFANYTASGERIIPPVTHKWKDEESRTNWLRAYVRAATGANRHKPRLLPADFKVEKDEINNEQAQFVETKKEAAYDCARLWRMPPHKIQLLDRATNNNIEHQGLEYVIDTLMSWLVMWEQAFRRDLIAEDDVSAEHNVAGLLRGDIKSRFAAYAVGRQWGWLNVDEIRALENQNPLPNGEGQQYLKPMNMVDASAPQPMEDDEKTEDSQPQQRPNGDARH